MEFTGPLLDGPTLVDPKNDGRKARARLTREIHQREKKAVLLLGAKSSVFFSCNYAVAIAIRSDWLDDHFLPFIGS